MNLKLGNKTFRDVQIPLLWGSRAVLQDKQGRLSVIDLSGGSPKLEIVDDKPASGIKYTSDAGAFTILSGGKVLSKGKPIYRYNPREKTLVGIDLNLPECQVGPWEVRVDSNVFDFMMSGSVIGIEVTTRTGVSLGVPLPPSLSRLVI